jgi:beta-lactam-binding protein with PASTA domain
VTNKTKNQAINALAAAGFNYSASNCPNGASLVVSQNPDGGTTAIAGSTVSFSCS